MDPVNDQSYVTDLFYKDMCIYPVSKFRILIYLHNLVDQLASYAPWLAVWENDSNLIHKQIFGLCSHQAVVLDHLLLLVSNLQIAERENTRIISPNIYVIKLLIWMKVK